MAQAEVVLLQCALFFFYSSVCLCQLDCTGTNCPLLDNCIEEVLESGACCASCLQKGCACEGYQYYDCISAGFKNGKVPEGDSYFVDYGSTECSCPVGGGRISCHFISCPDMPPNCIEVSEPADGCMQCERVGCVHAGQKFEAGYSFHIDPCRVCHCPNEGGKLMCYPVPDCDPQQVHKPMLAAPTEDNTVIRHDNFPYRFDQQGHTDQFATPYHLPNGNLPLFKLSPLDKEKPEDYDYGPTDFPETYPQSLLFPTPSSSSFKKVLSVSQGSVKPDRISSLQTQESAKILAVCVCVCVCSSVAQKQCCLSSVKERQCELGVTSARGGDTCDVDERDSCLDDSYQVCCSCCVLGLRVRSEGRGCDAHQHLGYPCGHIFLTCCEEGDALSLLRRKQKPRPTALPRKVSDNKFPKEAFSISSTDEAANTVEEQEDVDECELYPGQLCQHTCTNIWGSYRCSCHQGYILQLDGHSCAPGTKTNTAHHSEHTIPTVRYGDNGGCSQQCKAVAGRARCSCFPGFSLMTDGWMCEDVDECVTGAHSCKPSQRCVNTVGSFVCELQVTCPAGYQLRNSLCEDIDECTMRTHNCGMGLVCENTVGSFLCNPKQKCISGFTQDSHGNCIDINECSSLTEPCSSGFNCINTVGSYTCQKKIVMCSHGYHASPDGAKCVDTDECQMGTHRCGVGQICHNLPGSYRCDCQTGYQYNALRKVCTDVNECWRYSGRLCAQKCENTPGSYRCSCTAGFSLAFDGKNCEDTNECDQNPCSQECANIYGSYQCYCRPGYYLKDDGHTCEDIDECSQSIGNLCAFQCVNTAGSYQCACPPHGYVMAANGRTCKDIDECTTGTHNCSTGQTCYNLQGGFRCLSFDCPQHYKKVSNTRCERINCPASSLDCKNSPLWITYYQLTYETNIIIPAQIFRIGPNPAYSGDHIVISIRKGNEEGYFSTRKLNSFTGAVYLQRKVREPKDFLIDVEMKLLRQGTFTSFLAKIHVFITPSTM
uniref:Fibulin 2 n=1 Tax=Astatotilapia calliptera TaxID=8154 RepID=A0A3P8R8R8_ASTCA